MILLHVEDNSMDADLVAQVLERAIEAIQIDLVTSLGEARERLLGPRSFDVALIDLQLPDGSGLDLLTEIRERQLQLPVVLLTGLGDQHAAIAALHSGADDYVQKDVDAYTQLPGVLQAARQRFTERRGAQSSVLRVLYAEHNRADVDLTRRHLAKFARRIRLTCVPDVVVALGHLPPGPAVPCDFDVVLLDYRLPGLDALEAVRTIRNERGLDVPIVVVSGQGGESVAAESIKLGVDDFIAKHSGYLHELAPTLEKVHRQHALRLEQRELRRTSEHLSYMLEASPVVLYTLEGDAGGVTQSWVSANITRLFGYSEIEALEDGWWSSRLHSDDAASAMDALDGLCDQRAVVHDYRFLDKDDKVHWIRDELRVLEEGDDGNFRVLGAWHDITEQKLAEQIQETRIATLDSLTGGIGLHEVLQYIADNLERTLPELRVSIMLNDQQRSRLVTAAAPSLPSYFSDAVDGTKLEVGCGSCGTAAAMREPVIVRDIMSHPSCEDYCAQALRAGIRACWSVPFSDEKGIVLGTLSIYHDEPREPEEGQLRLIGEFARIAGLAVQRANADTRLRQAVAVFDNTHEGVVITDLQSNIIAVNRAFTQITGFTEQEVLGCNPVILNSGRQDETFYQVLWESLLTVGHWRGEIWNRRKNGEVYPQLLDISTVRDDDGKAKNYVGVMTDISQLKQSEASLERLAHYDPLTDLPNRLLIQSRLEQALKEARRDNERVGVLFLDIDRFKDVNDSLGHRVGDALLQMMTQRLAARLRDEDSFGRLGGDEFLIIIGHGRESDVAAKVARELIGLLDAPFELPDGEDIYAGASIGISVFPEDGDDAATLIQHADAAMYQAKEEGRNTFRFYTPALTEAANRRISTEARMRRAIANGEFVIHYQPQVSIADRQIVGCEALLRWEDPQKGLVPPAEFIPLAEETGLIAPLGDWVLDRVAAQLRHWIDRGYGELCMAVNLSVRQLQNQADFVQQLVAAIDHYRLPVGRLKLEITESVIMAKGDEAEKLLRAIRDTGVRLSIDDFGTGYSSLAYLKRFPIDELKIDRSFVRDIPVDTDDAEIAATIIAMAHNLRLKVVAEGVETAEQAAFLVEHGCAFCQGYWYSRPVTADNVDRLLAGDDATDARRL